MLSGTLSLSLTVVLLNRFPSPADHHFVCLRLFLIDLIAESNKAEVIGAVKKESEEVKEHTREQADQIKALFEEKAVELEDSFRNPLFTLSRSSL